MWVRTEASGQTSPSLDGSVHVGISGSRVLPRDCAHSGPVLPWPRASVAPVGLWCEQATGFSEFAVQPLPRVERKNSGREAAGIFWSAPRYFCSYGVFMEAHGDGQDSSSGCGELRVTPSLAAASAQWSLF